VCKLCLLCSRGRILGCRMCWLYNWVLLRIDGGLVSAKGICRGTGAARTHLGSDLLSRERSWSVADRKTEMCSISDIYDKSVRKGV